MDSPATARTPLRLVGAWVALFLALAFALWRVFTLGTQPLHGDEAVQGYILGQFLETGRYAFNPAHFHGPLPHFLNAAWMWAAGISDYTALSAESLRATACVMWLLASLGLWAFARSSRRESCWPTLALWICAPLPFYYGGIYFHENFLLAAAVAAPLAAAWGLRADKCGPWLLAGLACGAMMAAKSTWLIIVLSWVCAAAALWVLQKFLPGFKRSDFYKNLRPRHVIAFILGALVCACALYTNGFTRMEGALDAVRTFFVYATDTGHEKPWFYYLKDILFFHKNFGELAITLPACVGFTLILFSKNRRAAAPSALLWLALAGAAQIVGYSLVAYKTPWLMLVPLAYLAPWAGWVFYHEGVRATLPATRRAAAIVLLGVCVLFNASQIARSDTAVFSQNPPPFTYVPTSADVPRLTKLLLERAPKGDIAIISPDAAIWPLPWYLRSAADRTGYFENAQTPSGDFAAYVFINASPDAATAAKWRKTHDRHEGILFLPGCPFIIYAPKQAE